MRTVLDACHGRAGPVAAALVLSLVTAACTASSGSAPAAHPGTPAAAVTPRAHSSTCTAAEIRASIAGFFTAWNHRDRDAFGTLFAADAAFAFAGKHQDTLTQGPAGYTEVGGPGDRSAIVALAEHQWALGERLLYRDLTAGTGPGPAGNGGGAVVVARFPDGTTQRLLDKFVYDCAARAFAHVVITSVMAARHNARPWSWRMP